MKKENHFQIAKVKPQGVAQILLDFCHFQPDVAYKSVAYKKVCRIQKVSEISRIPDKYRNNHF